MLILCNINMGGTAMTIDIAATIITVLMLLAAGFGGWIRTYTVPKFKPNIRALSNFKNLLKKRVRVGSVSLDYAKNYFDLPFNSRIIMPKNMSIGDYIKDAFNISIANIQEGASQNPSVTLNIKIDALIFDIKKGLWIVKGKVKVKENNSLEFKTTTYFNTMVKHKYLNYYTTQAFTTAVTDFVKKVSNDSEFVWQINDA